MRPSAACSLSSICAWRARSVAASSGASLRPARPRSATCACPSARPAAPRPATTARPWTARRRPPQLQRVAHVLDAHALDRQVALVTLALRVGDVQGVGEVGHEGAPKHAPIWRARVPSQGLHAGALANGSAASAVHRRSAGRGRSAGGSTASMPAASRPHHGQQLGRVAMFDEAVGQAQVQQRHADAGRGQAFTHRAAGAAGDAALFDRDQASCVRASSSTSASSSGLAKRMSATVASSLSAAASAGCSTVPKARMATLAQPGARRTASPPGPRARGQVGLDGRADAGCRAGSARPPGGSGGRRWSAPAAFVLVGRASACCMLGMQRT
jgi:hypothetical protein